MRSTPSPVILPASAAAARADLAWLNLADALRGFGLAPAGWAAGPLAVALRPAALRLAHELVTLDALTAADSLAVAADWICSRLAAGRRVDGPRPPAVGPLLIVANHPGLLDGAALAAAIGRPDLRILAIARPFLRAMPAVRETLIDVGETPASRMTALRNAMRHLRRGGALLTFPAGRIEPDPAHDRAAAHASLEQHWPQSLTTYLQLFAGVPLLPAAVSGVLAPDALRHPLLQLRRTPADRAWLAAILQLLPVSPAPTTVAVRFAAPLAVPATVAEVTAVFSDLLSAEAQSWRSAAPN